MHLAKHIKQQETNYRQTDKRVDRRTVWSAVSWSVGVGGHVSLSACRRVVLSHRTVGRRAGGAGALVGHAPEEAVLQSVVRRHARRRVVVEHALHEVDELGVVVTGVARLTSTPPARTTRLTAEDVV